MMLKMGVINGLVALEELSEESPTGRTSSSWWLTTFRQPDIYLIWKFVCRIFTTVVIICGIIFLIKNVCRCNRFPGRSHIAASHPTM